MAIKFYKTITDEPDIVKEIKYIDPNGITHDVKQFYRDDSLEWIKPYNILPGEDGYIYNIKAIDINYTYGNECRDVDNIIANDYIFHGETLAITNDIEYTYNVIVNGDFERKRPINHSAIFGLQFDSRSELLTPTLYFSNCIGEVQIDWGDGTKTTKNLSEPSENITKETMYSNTGAYHIIVDISKTEPNANKYVKGFSNNAKQLTKVAYYDDNLHLALGWGEYSDFTSLEYCTITTGITNIPPWSFSGCPLKKLVLPDTITSIGTYAFCGCNFEILVTPDSVTEIDTHAFASCSHLKEVTLSKNLTTIASDLFNSCTNLTEISIPEGVTYIGSNAFRFCSKLKSISLPDTLKSIGSLAFQGCTSLEELIIPDSVYSMPALSGCTNLETLHLPEAITSIPDRLISDTLVQDLVIPKNVKKISFNAFVGAPTGLQLTLPHYFWRLKISSDTYFIESKEGFTNYMFTNRSDRNTINNTYSLSEINAAYLEKVTVTEPILESPWGNNASTARVDIYTIENTNEFSLTCIFGCYLNGKGSQHVIQVEPSSTKAIQITTYCHGTYNIELITITGDDTAYITKSSFSNNIANPTPGKDALIEITN